MAVALAVVEQQLQLGQAGPVLERLQGADDRGLEGERARGRGRARGQGRGGLDRRCRRRGGRWCRRGRGRGCRRDRRNGGRGRGGSQAVEGRLPGVVLGARAGGVGHQGGVGDHGVAQVDAEQRRLGTADSRDLLGPHRGRRPAQAAGDLGRVARVGRQRDHDGRRDLSHRPVLDQLVVAGQLGDGEGCHRGRHHGEKAGAEALGRGMTGAPRGPGGSQATRSPGRARDESAEHGGEAHRHEREPEDHQRGRDHGQRIGALLVPGSPQAPPGQGRQQQQDGVDHA